MRWVSGDEAENYSFSFCAVRLFTTATLIATFYITNTAEDLLGLIRLHQIENIRRTLIISIQTVQSDLYTVHTLLSRKLYAIIDNVSDLDRSAGRCLSCHHQESIYQQIQNVRSLIEDYKNALSYYITASANKNRIDSIQSEAARIGDQLLRRTEDMSTSATNRLAVKTVVATKNVRYARTVIYVMLMTSLILGVFVSVNLTRSITKPIGELVGATKIIAAGSLGHIIADNDKTEFGELARNFNAMSLTLKDGYDRLEAANRELQRQITERKRMEERLRQSQKMEAIGTLAGGIAHDFNNILVTMINYTELAMNNVPSASPEWHYLQKVLMGGERAKDLVRQILFFSRQSERELKPVQIYRLVNDLMPLLRASLPSTVDVQQKIKEDAGTVLGDSTQLDEVLMNLCANAEYAMREKGGVLELCADAVDVDETLAALYPDLHPGPYVRLSVRDNGDGMKPEVVERVFEPFFTTKEAGQGTGMGLAVVHGIIANHGGTVTVESAPEEGTTFTICHGSTDWLKLKAGQKSRSCMARSGFSMWMTKKIFWMRSRRL